MNSVGSSSGRRFSASASGSPPCQQPTLLRGSSVRTQCSRASDRQRAASGEAQRKWASSSEPGQTANMANVVSEGGLPISCSGARASHRTQPARPGRTSDGR